MDYKRREDFLKIFVPQLAEKYETAGHTGVKAMARALHKAINFTDADGRIEPVHVECIEKELSSLFHQMYPDKQK
ncbi:hypothetical protein [uncultured Bacteroides sp.]|uniref:hypothetical protein n=1 Tax=uncultured Bacteroides sp. TaxID=162156 RepID=UPI00262E5FE5|nr:hypothetical protein [uncultured Bacteroides sp.]